ncbi:MAG: endolytic transglycosylase MltG [Mucinivorans sp.]
MKKRLKPAVKKIIIIVGAIAAVLVAVGTYVIVDEYQYRFSAAILRNCELKIYPGQTLEDVADALGAEGYIASAAKMKRTAREQDKDSVAVGYYTFNKGISYRTLLTYICAGHQSVVKMTFNNIRTLDQLATRVARYTLASKDDFMSQFTQEATDSGDSENYISYFMPNTYEVYWTITPAEFTAMMREEYADFWDSKGRRSKAEDLGLTPHEVMTLASIVIEETKAEQEMTAVAGVYVNRLRKKMPLQADPTVKFAVGDFSLRRIKGKHLRYKSPYNTYLNAGLPPGPICVPPSVAIDAVLDYVDNEHKWIYFCANADFSGTHAFASSWGDHLRNAAAYHRELNRRKIR